jgi:hypothetical protein
MGGHGGPVLTGQRRRSGTIDVTKLAGSFEDKRPGFSNLMRLPWSTGADSGLDPTRPVQISGFRHFISDPTLPQQFRIHGHNVHTDQGITDELRGLMARLADRLVGDIDWPAHTAAYVGQFDPPPAFVPPPENYENPCLPSGYTYLLQLVAHDLVDTSLALSIIEDARIGVRNARTSLLRLDTIYGDGPAVCPFAYALDALPNAYADGTRTKMRLGRMTRKGEEKGRGAWRDIARSSAENVTGVDQAGILTEPLIADPRNDDHAILAQLTALFHHLHNGIVDKLQPLRDQDVMAHSADEAAMQRYLCARFAVTLIYRNIVRKDLMRRVLHPDIYQRYALQQPIFLDTADQPLSSERDCDDDRSRDDRSRDDLKVTLEFSHAAFRFAHAMVRDFYRINENYRPDTYNPAKSGFRIGEVLRQTSAKNPADMPLNTDWIADWSYFFKLRDDVRPNLSMRIGPRIGQTLLFDSIDSLMSGRLAYRDLLSGAFAGLWSVGPLLQEIEARNPELIALSPLLKTDQSGHDARSAMIKAYLGMPGADDQHLTEADIETLSNDPPLFLFVLCEAACDAKSQGLRLGVLGSIIVAETIFKILMLDPVLPAEASGDLKRSLRALAELIYGPQGANTFDDVPEIDSMAALIRYTAKLCDLEAADPAFL